MIGHRLKELRLEKGLSQQELGDLIGVTKVSICGYENGTRTPSLETFLLIADTFTITTDYLVGREVAVVCEGEDTHIGYLSEKDMEINHELKRNPGLYNRIIEDPRRMISLINKKMKNDLK